MSLYHGHSHCCSSHETHPHHGPWPPCGILYVPYPVPWPAEHQPIHAHPPTPPREVTTDEKGGAVTALIGGSGKIGLRLEYWTDSGATAPAVKLTLEEAGHKATWTEDPAAAGYQVRTPFGKVAPGARLTLEVKQVKARLSWRETACC